MEKSLQVATIVEGHGEVSAFPILIERIWYEMLKEQSPIEILRPPIRQPRNRLVTNKDNALTRAVGLACAKLSATGRKVQQAIIILIDADEDPPCVIGPQITELARQARSDIAITCVVAHVEYETWFVAAAESLQRYVELSQVERSPESPEESRQGKGWIEKRFKGAKYSETIDQPKLTAMLDLAMCRKRSPSFDKLCRELERLSQTLPASAE